MEEVGWVVDHLEDLDADFLALYGIEDPWSLPAWRFFDLAMRVFFYQGVMTFRIMEEAEESSPSPATRQTQASDGEKEVKEVPLAGLLGMIPGIGEYVQVKKEVS